MQSKNKNTRRNKRLSPGERREVIKVLYFYEHCNQTEIAKKLGVDRSAICRDLKEIHRNFSLKTLNVELLSSLIQFKCEMRQRDLADIFKKNSNPHVQISCLAQLRAEDKVLVDLLSSVGKLRQAPEYQERKPLCLILTTDKPNGESVQEIDKKK